MKHTLLAALLLLTLAATAQFNPLTKDSTYNKQAFDHAKTATEIAFNGYTFSRSQPAAFPVQGHHFSSKHGAISIYPDWFMGVLFTDTGNINITHNKEGRYRLLNDRNLPPSEFMCQTPEAPHKHEHETEYKSASGTCKSVGVWLIGDASLIRIRGSQTNAEQFMIGLFNVKQAIYAMENIRMEISQLTVWNTNPFSMTASANTILSSLRNWVPTQTYSGNLVSLLSLEAGGRGGLAYLSGLCSTTGFNTNYSNINNSFSGFPVYSASVVTLAHEVGHNLSANHTHWCGWLHPDGTRRPIDFCFAVEPFNGVCYNGPVIRAGGTIMSYCHLNGTIDMSLGFGSIVGNTMRNYINSSTCVSGQLLSGVNVAGDFRVCAGQTPQRLITGALPGAIITWSPPQPAIGTNTATVALNGCTVTKAMPIVQNPVATTLSENFESITSLPSTWQVINPNANATFEVSTLASARGVGSRSMRISNFSSPNSTGYRDSLFLPVVSQAGKRVTGIRLDYAYIRFNTGTFYLDTLELALLVNCNNKQLIRLFREGGESLSTNPARVGSNFIPTSTEWRTLNYDLSVANYTQAQLVIINKSGWGNPIYFDNIEFILGDAVSGCASATVPAQPAQIQGLAGICSGGTQTYSVAAQLDATTYQWTVPTGSFITSGQGTNSITVGNTQAGTISVIASNCRGNSVARTLTIALVTAPAQPPPIVGMTNICYSGLELYSVPQVPNTTWNWSIVGGSYTFTGQGTSQIIATWTVPGSQIRVQAQNACGVSTVRTLTLTPIPPLVASEIQGSTRVCSTANTTFTALPLNANASYVWTFPSGWSVVSQSSNTITVRPSGVAGNVSVSMRDNINCSSAVTPLLSIATIIDCGVVQPCTLADITQPSDPVDIVNGTRVDSRNPPLNEEPFRAFDNLPTTKYLNFTGAGSGVIVNVARTHQAIQSIALTSGNDAPERDPATYRIEGWNGSWQLVSEGSVPVFASRRQRVVLNFLNNAGVFGRYRVVFPTLRGTSFFQISEIELLGCGGSQAVRLGTFDVYGREVRVAKPGIYWKDGKRVVVE